MVSTTAYYTALEGTLISQIAADATTANVKVKDINGTTPTWLTSAHRIVAIQETKRSTKVEVMSISSVSQSGTTVTLTIGTRALPLDGTGFSGTGTAQVFTSGAKFILTWDAQSARQAAFKDIANTFSAAQTISSTNKLFINDSGTYLFDDGTDLIFKDSNNSETTLSTLAATGGADEKVGVDSSATAGYLGAASTDGVLRTGDGLSYADGGNYVTLDVAKLKDAASSELTISSGAVTHTNSYHTIDTEADAASDDLDTISGGASGDYLTIRAENDARTVVVKHGTGNIITADNADFSIDTDDKSITLRYDGSNWREVARAGTTSSNYVEILDIEHVTSTTLTNPTTLTEFDTGQFTLTAGDLIAGTSLEFSANGTVTPAAGNVNIYFRIGSVDIVSHIITPASTSAQKWILKGEVRGTAAAGASVTVDYSSQLFFAIDGTDTHSNLETKTGSTASVVTNSNQTCKFMGAIGTSNGANVMALDGSTVKLNRITPA